MTENKQMKKWSEKIADFIADILLIDTYQTYESCKHANIIATIICRSILLGIGFYFNYFIGCTLDTKYYGLFAFSLIIVIETCHICVRRNGIDFKWFSPSYLAFSIQCIAVLWIGSEYTHELHDSECHKNHTHLLYKKMLRHCVIPYFPKSYCVSLSVILCIFLITIITVRRHSPIKAFNETHSVLLVFYLSAAADIVDFSEYSKSETLIKKLQGVTLIWALVLISSLLFSFQLTAKKKINFENIGFKSFLDLFFGTEIWSIFLVLFTLELPFTVARIYFLAKFGILADPTLFFLLKNLFMMYEDFRRAIIYYHDYQEKKLHHNSSAQNNIVSEIK